MPEMNDQALSAPNQEPQDSGEHGASKAKKRRKRHRRPLILTILIRIIQIIGTLILIGVITGTFMEIGRAHV